MKEETESSLGKVSGSLQAYPGLKLQVEGYTDSVGSDEYNQKLSENRADAVRNFLLTQGVQEANITSTGYGKAKPVADNATAQGRAQNRRWHGGGLWGGVRVVHDSRRPRLCSAN